MHISTTNSALDPNQFPDLSSWPKHRHFRSHPLVDRTRAAVPFDNVVISGLDIARFDHASCKSIDSDLPPSFVSTYYEEELYRNDPFVIGISATESVLVEADVYVRHPISERLSYVLESHNIRNRTYFLLKRGNHVYAAVGFTRQQPFTEEERSYLQMIAQPLHRAFTKPIMDRFAAEHLKLSHGEVECLRLASTGLTTDEIAEATGLQKNTINTYFQLAARKLGAINRPQAIAEALRRMLID